MKSLILPIILGISLSYSQQVQDIVRDNTFTTKRQKVKTLLKDPNLSDKDRAGLDELWNHAQRIGRLNDRCASISLNDVLDETCQNFYKVELPAFDELYSKVTNDIRMNGLSLLRSVNDERAFMTACVDALYDFDFHPSNFYKANATFTVEPLMDGAELSYVIHLESIHRGAATKWLENSFKDLCNWNKYRDKKFVAQLASNYNESRNPHFQLQGKDIHPRRGYSFIYTINGKKVFSGRIKPENIIYSFDSWELPTTDRIRASCHGLPAAVSHLYNRAADNCRGTIKLSEDDLVNGIVGTLIWKED